MPFPVVPAIIAAGAAALAGRKAKDHFDDHPPLKGKCSNCGHTCKHTFLESGVKWGNSGPTAVLFGMLGLGILSFAARNVYQCTNCKHRTLRCRMPGCEGMALSTEYYDHELCGACRNQNDRSDAYKEKERGRKAVKDNAKIKAQLEKTQKALKTLNAKLTAVEAEIDRTSGENQKLRQQRDTLAQIIKTMQQERDAYARQAAA